MSQPDRPCILLVDDDSLLCAIVTETLEDGGYSVQTIGDGRDVMETLWMTRPALVILDCNLPGRPGMLLLEDIRQSAPDREVPVLMLTGRQGQWNETAAIRNGANRYMRKPFAPEELMVTVAQLMRDRHGAVG